jgi:uncharacterized protein YjbJ (UPF0337 family)
MIRQSESLARRQPFMPLPNDLIYSVISCKTAINKEKLMNNDTLQGKWQQLRGNIKTAFGKLTDDDLLQADGNTDKMIGALRARYGYTKEKAQTEWNKFAQQHADKVEDAKTDLNAATDDIKAAVSHLKDAVQR